MGRTVVLADDTFIVREGVRLVLERAGYDPNAVAEDYDELMDAVDDHRPEVFLTDVRMPPTRTDEGI